MGVKGSACGPESEGPGREVGCQSTRFEKPGPSFHLYRLTEPVEEVDEEYRCQHRTSGVDQTHGTPHVRPEVGRPQRSGEPETGPALSTWIEASAGGIKDA